MAAVVDHLGVKEEDAPLFLGAMVVGVGTQRSKTQIDPQVTLNTQPNHHKLELRLN